MAIPSSAFRSTSNPTYYNDSSQGFILASAWYNTTTGHLWRCVDPTVGAALWVDVGTGVTSGGSTWLHGSHHVGNGDDPIPVATTSVAGLLSNTDKIKLDSVDETSYVKLDGTRSMAADLNLNSHKIINLTDPASAQDAATKAYVDAHAGGTVADGSITDVKLRASAGTSIIGRASNSSGTVADITASSNDLALVRVSDSLSFSQINTGMLADGSVTPVKRSDQILIFQTTQSFTMPAGWNAVMVGGYSGAGGGGSGGGGGAGGVIGVGGGGGGGRGGSAGGQSVFDIVGPITVTPLNTYLATIGTGGAGGTPGGLGATTGGATGGQGINGGAGSITALSTGGTYLAIFGRGTNGVATGGTGGGAGGGGGGGASGGGAGGSGGSALGLSVNAATGARVANTAGSNGGAGSNSGNGSAGTVTATASGTGRLIETTNGFIIQGGNGGSAGSGADGSAGGGGGGAGGHGGEGSVFAIANILGLPALTSGGCGAGAGAGGASHAATNGVAGGVGGSAYDGTHGRGGGGGQGGGGGGGGNPAGGNGGNGGVGGKGSDGLLILWRIA